MKSKYWWAIFIGLVITFIGLITRKYFFLLLIFPIGYLLKDDKEELEE